MNTLVSSTIDAWKAQLWYVMVFLMAKVMLKDDFKIIILMDTGLKINVKTQKVMKDASLAM